MNKGSGLLGVGLVVLGVALVGLAVFWAFAAYNSNTVDIPVSLRATAAPPSIAVETPTEEAVILPSQTLPSTTAAPALPSAPPEETTTRVVIAPKPTAPIAQPTPSPYRAVRIVIPVLHLDARVVEMPSTVVMEDGERVANWLVPKYDVGHAVGSANPGEQNNVVMSAHNNLYAALFRKLYTIKTGDEITVYNAAGASFLYQVTQSYIVQEAGVSFAQQVANAQVMLPTKDARLTLISCYPENNNTHRAIVIARLLGAGK